MARRVQYAKEERLLAELRSLGVDPRRKTELNDEEELAELADNIKQYMLQDYKTAYSKKGDKYESESKSTVDH
jgi:hypothetical protein